MRMMVKFMAPVEKSNRAFNDGTIESTIRTIVETFKPEATYFTTIEGKRGGFMVFDMTDPSQIPQIAEPLFHNLEAAVEFVPVMNIEDLQRGIAAARS